MNEELVKYLYDNLKIEGVGKSIDEFRKDLESEEMQKYLHTNLSMDKHGKSLEQFQKDLGVYQVSKQDTTTEPSAKPVLEPFTLDSPELRNMSRIEKLREIERRQKFLKKLEEPTLGGSQDEDVKENYLDGDAGAFVNSIPLLGDWVDDMARAFGKGRAKADALSSMLEVLGTGSESLTDEQIRGMIEAGKKMDLVGSSNEFNEFMKAGGFTTLKGLGTLLKNAATIVPELSIDSFVALYNKASLGAGVTAAAGGAAAGAAIGGPLAPLTSVTGALGSAFFAGNATLESGLRYLELVREQMAKDNLNFENKEDVKKFLQSEGKQKDLQVKAIAAGLTIGAINTLGLKLASVAGVKALTKTGSRVALVGAAGLTEAVTEGGGEGAGRFVAGQEWDWNEVGLEAIGGMGNVVYSGLNAAYKGTPYKVNKERVSRKAVEKLIKDMPAADLKEANIEIPTEDPLYNTYQDKIDDYNTREAMKGYSEADTEAVIKLNAEKRKFANNPSSAAKKRVAEIEGKINEIIIPKKAKDGSTSNRPGNDNNESGPKVVGKDSKGTKGTDETGGKTAEAKKTTDEVADEEYKNFVDNNNVAEDRINKIADKYARGENLSDKELTIANSKIEDLNKALTKKYKGEVQLETVVTDNKDSYVVDQNEAGTFFRDKTTGKVVEDPNLEKTLIKKVQDGKIKTEKTNSSKVITTLPEQSVESQQREEQSQRESLKEKEDLLTKLESQKETATPETAAIFSSAIEALRKETEALKKASKKAPVVKEFAAELEEANALEVEADLTKQAKGTDPDFVPKKSKRVKLRDAVKNLFVASESSLKKQGGKVPSPNNLTVDQTTDALTVLYSRIAKAFAKREGITPQEWLDSKLKLVSNRRITNLKNTKNQLSPELQTVAEKIVGDINNKDSYITAKREELESKAKDGQDVTRQLAELDKVEGIINGQSVKTQGSKTVVKGAVVSTPEGSILRGFSAADVSTGIHELFHVFEDVLTSEEKQFIVDEYNKVNNKKEVIAGDGTLTTDVSEWAARSFEEFTRNPNNVDSSALKKIFETFKFWLQEIYKGGVPDTIISPEMNAFFKDLVEPSASTKELSRKGGAAEGGLATNTTSEGEGEVNPSPIQQSEKALAEELTKVNNISPKKAKTLSGIMQTVYANIAKRLGMSVGDYKRSTAVRTVNSVSDFIRDIPNSIQGLRGLSSEFISNFEGATSENALFQDVFGKVDNKYEKNNGLNTADYILSALLSMEDSFKFLGFPKLSAIAKREDIVKEIESRLDIILDKATNSNEFYIQEFSEGFIKSGQERAATQQEKDVYEAMLNGDKRILETQLKHIQGLQRDNLLGSLSYLIPSKDYSAEFKYLIIAAALKGNQSKDITITDADGNVVKTIPGNSAKRNAKTVGNHQELSSMVLPNVYQDMLQGSDKHPMELINIHTDLSYITREETQEIIKDRIFKKTKDGVWVKFSKSEEASDIDALTKVSKKVQKVMDKNPWCTGGGMARSYLPSGDFYLFLDNELEPKITIRCEKDQIAELRGTESGQSLSVTENIIVEPFLSEIPNGESYLTSVLTTKLYHKLKNNEVPKTEEDFNEFVSTYTTELNTYDFDKRREFRSLKEANIKVYSDLAQKLKLYDYVGDGFTDIPAGVKNILIISASKSDTYIPEGYVNGDVDYVTFVGSLVIARGLKLKLKGLKVSGELRLDSAQDLNGVDKLDLRESSVQMLLSGGDNESGVITDKFNSSKDVTINAFGNLSVQIKKGCNIENLTVAYAPKLDVEEDVSISNMILRSPSIQNMKVSDQARIHHLKIIGDNDDFVSNFSAPKNTKGLFISGLNGGVIDLTPLGDMEFITLTDMYLDEVFFPHKLTVSQLELSDILYITNLQLPSKLKTDKLEITGVFSGLKTLTLNDSTIERLQIDIDRAEEDLKIDLGTLSCHIANISIPYSQETVGNVAATEEFNYEHNEQRYSNDRQPEGTKINLKVNSDSISFLNLRTDEVDMQGSELMGAFTYIKEANVENLKLPNSLNSRLALVNSVIGNLVLPKTSSKEAFLSNIEGTSTIKAVRAPIGASENIKQITVDQVNNGVFIRPQDNRGAIVMTPEATLMLLDKNNADVTTPIHELSHEYEKTLTKKEVQILEDWSGHKKGTTEFSEAFAKGAERYIYEGHLFNGKVDKIYAKLKKWFAEVIKDAVVYFGDINQLNDEVKDIYSKMLIDGTIAPSKAAAVDTNATTRLQEFEGKIGELKEIKQIKRAFIQFIRDNPDLSFDDVYDIIGKMFAAKGITKKDAKRSFNIAKKSAAERKVGTKGTTLKELGGPKYEKVFDDDSFKHVVERWESVEQASESLLEDFLAFDLKDPNMIPILFKVVMNSDTTTTVKQISLGKLFKIYTQEARRYAKENPTSETNPFHDAAIKAMEELYKIGRDSARSLNIMKVFKEMGADGKIYYATKMLANVRQKIKDKNRNIVDTAEKLAKKAAEEVLNKPRVFKKPRITFQEATTDADINFIIRNMGKNLHTALQDRFGLLPQDAIALSKEINAAVHLAHTEAILKLGPKGSIAKARKIIAGKKEQILTENDVLDVVSEISGTKIKSLTPEFIKYVQDEQAKIDKLPTALWTQFATAQLLRAIHKQVGALGNSNLFKENDSLYWGLWYASVLSGFSTQYINFVSSLLNGLLTSLAIKYSSKTRTDLTKAEKQGLNSLPGYFSSEVIKTFTGTSVQGREFSMIFKHGVKRTDDASKFYDSSSLERVAKLWSRRAEQDVQLSMTDKIFGPVAHIAKYVPRLMAATDAMFNTSMRLALLDTKLHADAYNKVLAYKEANGTSGEMTKADIKNALGYGRIHDYVRAQMNGTSQDHAASMKEARGALTDTFGTFETDPEGKQYTEADVSKLADDILEQKVLSNLGLTENVLIQDEINRLASRVTYNQDPEGFLGDVARAISKTQNSENAVFAGTARFLVPFTRVLANVMNEQLEYTPVGFSMAGYSINGKPSKLSQGRTVTERRAAVAKATIGTALWAIGIGILLAIDLDDEENSYIKLHGEGPKGINEIMQLKAIGWKPNSIQIGDFYWSVQDQSIGVMVGMLGNWFDRKRYKDGDAEEGLGAGLSTLFSMSLESLQSLLNKTFFASALDMVEVFQEPDPDKLKKGFGKWLARQVRPVIPNAVRQTMAAFNGRWYQTEDGFDVLYKDFAVPWLSVTGNEDKVNLNTFQTSLGDDMNLTFGTMGKIGKILGPEREIAIQGPSAGIPAEDYELYKYMKDYKVFTTPLAFSTAIEKTSLYGFDKGLFLDLNKERGKILKKMLRKELPKLKEMSKKEAQERVKELGSAASKQVKGTREYARIQRLILKHKQENRIFD